MFEHHTQPILPRKDFLSRLMKFTLTAVILVVVSWLIGIVGYRIFEGMPWIDATLNAAMILGGMGPVNQLYTNAGKIFASLYALFSGVVFLISIGILLAPIIHRFYHKFHLQNKEK